MEVAEFIIWKFSSILVLIYSFYGKLATLLLTNFLSIDYGCFEPFFITASYLGETWELIEFFDIFGLPKLVGDLPYVIVLGIPNAD
jgi:hypothetical protein